MNEYLTEIDDAKCCELIQQLVAIESFSGNERAASEFLVGQFQRLGYDRAWLDSVNNAIGIRGDLENAQTTIILLGHIDTVPGDIPVRLENGILYGRGSVDAKGPLATFALAGSIAKLPEGVCVVVVGAVEEESATSKGARQIAKDFRADYCVIGEPSSASAITLGYKGRVLIDYSNQVAEAHTAGPEKNAAELATGFWFRVLQHCNEFNQTRDKLFDQLLPSLRSIRSHSDGIHSTANLKIGVRLPLEFEIDSFQEFVSGLCEQAAVRFYGYEPAWQSDRSNNLVRALAWAIRKEGLKPGYKLKTGTADMNVVAPVWRCPIVAYGPGDSSLDHTPNEHLHLDEFLQAIRILSNAIGELAAMR